MPTDRTAQAPPATIARIDAQLCTACGQCIEVCPVGAITLEETAIVDETQCVGCGACAEACPMEAISLAKISVEQGEVG
jgi:ferredoxin